MFRNYLKLAVRNIMKHKFFSAINILGMSIGITACLLILLYLFDELSYDRFHANAERIYQIGLHAKIGDQDITTANTPPPMAESFVKEIPGVEHATRIGNYWGSPSLKVEDKSFTEEKVFHADSNFFEFFSYRLIKRDPKTVLTEPNTAQRFCLPRRNESADLCRQRCYRHCHRMAYGQLSVDQGGGIQPRQFIEV